MRSHAATAYAQRPILRLEGKALDVHPLPEVRKKYLVQYLRLRGKSSWNDRLPFIVFIKLY